MPEESPTRFRIGSTPQPLLITIGNDELHCLAKMPAQMLIDLNVDVGWHGVEWCLKVLRSVIVEADRATLEEALRSTTIIVDASDIAEAVDWLMGRYLHGFPTAPLGGSSDGPAGDEPDGGSPANSPSEEPAPASSEPTST